MYTCMNVMIVWTCVLFDLLLCYCQMSVRLRGSEYPGYPGIKTFSYLMRCTSCFHILHPHIIYIHRLLNFNNTFLFLVRRRQTRYSNVVQLDSFLHINQFFGDRFASFFQDRFNRQGIWSTVRRVLLLARFSWSDSCRCSITGRLLSLV